MRTHQVYRSDRPELLVERGGGARLGNCYNATYFKVTSRRALSLADLQALQTIGVLDAGQEFYGRQVTADDDRVTVPPVLDWRTRSTVVASGFDTVPCVEVDAETGKVIRILEAFKPSRSPFFVYECECRVDSSD